MPLPGWLGALLGGAIGSWLRYVVTKQSLIWLPGYRGAGTLLVNVIGCLAIGYLAGGGAEHKTLSPAARTFLVSGLLGGLTTFSSLALETVLLSRGTSTWWAGGLHLAANLGLGLGGVLVGDRLARWWPL